MTDIRIYKEDEWTTYIDLPNFEFGDSREHARGQATKETIDGYLTVTDRGFKRMPIAFVLRELTQSHMYDAKEFFQDTLKLSMYRFWIRIPNNRRTSNWNPMVFTIRVDSMIGGDPLEVDDGYTVDEKIASDYEFIGPIRLTSAVRFISTFEGIFDLSLQGVIEHEE